jgi:hypothetical protein
MATLGVGAATGYPGGPALTLLDWAKRLDPKGSIPLIVEMLSQTNEILDDMLWVEANSKTSHKTIIRTGLPQAYWRLINQGVPRGKSTTAPITESCGMLSAFSDVDVDLASLSGNEKAFRLSEDVAFQESMNQQMASTVFYNNISGVAGPTGSLNGGPAAFMGLAPRYGYKLATNAQTASNVIDAGGTSSTCTSVWLISWGPQHVFGIFPEGSKAGFQQIDRGQQQVLDANGYPYYAWRTEYKWHAGLVVRDWRYAVRIANIDASLLSGGTPTNLLNMMVRAIHRLPMQPAGAGPVQTADAKTLIAPRKTAFYCNRTVATWLDIQAMNKANMLLKIDEFDGKPRTSFRGIPIRVCDQVLNTETYLSS